MGRKNRREKAEVAASRAIDAAVSVVAGVDVAADASDETNAVVDQHEQPGIMPFPGPVLDSPPAPDFAHFWVLDADLDRVMRERASEGWECWQVVPGRRWVALESGAGYGEGWWAFFRKGV